MLQQAIRGLLVAVIFVTAISLTGCASSSLRSDAIVEDIAPALSASVIVRPDVLYYGKRKHKTNRGGIELGYESFRGESNQSIIQYTHLEFPDGGSIDGPQNSHNTIREEYGYLAYNHIFRFGSNFQIEPALGLVYEKYRLTALGSNPGSTPFAVDGHQWGIYASVTPRWKFNEYWAVEVRVDGATNPNVSTESTESVAFVFSPSSHLNFKAGYYGHDNRIETPSNASNIKTKVSGFAGGVTVIF